MFAHFAFPPESDIQDELKEKRDSILRGSRAFWCFLLNNTAIFNILSVCSEPFTQTLFTFLARALNTPQNSVVERSSSSTEAVL